MQRSQTSHKHPWLDRPSRPHSACREHCRLLRRPPCCGSQLSPGQKVFLLSAVLLRTAWANGAPWKLQTADAPWHVRDSFAVASLGDGSVLVLGGWDGNFCVNDVWRTTAEDAGEHWELQTDDAEWSPRKFAAAVSLSDGSILLMGGYDGHFFHFNDIWRSTTSSLGASWTKITENADWSKRSSFAAVALADDSLLVMGGCCFSNDVWRSEPGSMGATWTLQRRQAPWSKRAYHTAVALPNETHPSEPGGVLIMGGAATYGRTTVYSNDVWFGSNDGTSWFEQTAAAGWSGRTSPSVVTLLDGSVLVFMGASQSGDHRYDLNGDVWRSPPGSAGATWELQTAATGWNARIGVATLLTTGPYRGRVMMMGGFVYDEEGDAARENDVWRTELPCNIDAPAFGMMGGCVELVESRTSCRPTCFEGYTLSNDALCWDGNVTEAVCLPNACDSSTPPENAAPGDCPDMLPSGHTCQPECEQGYNATGPSYCYLGNLTTARCDPNPCEVGPEPENGELNDCPAILISGTGCYPMCDDGYTPDRSTFCYLGNLTKTTCKPNSCMNASVPPLNGDQGNCPDVLPSGSSCQPGCDSGYAISGVSSCLLGNLSRASCHPKTCNTSEAPEYGGRGDCPDVLASGASCQPVCDDGYSLLGMTSCMLGNLTLAQCAPDPCNTSSEPEHGARGDCPEILSSGAACQPTCNIGYTVSGPTTCSLGNLSAAECLANPCDLLQVSYISEVRFADGAKSQSDGSGAAKTMDGDCSSFYQSALGQSSNQWVSYDFGEVIRISGMQLYQKWNLEGPSSFNISFSKDDTTWEEVPELFVVKQDISRRSYTAACDEARFENFTFSTIKAQYLRVNFLSNHGSTDYIAVNELRFVTPQALKDVGRGNCTDMLESGDRCQPVCPEGYTITGPLVCYLGNTTIPSCEPNACILEDEPEHGSFGDCPSALPSAQRCQPTCDDGYVASGPATCELGNLSMTICTEAACVLDMVPENGLRGDCPLMLSSRGVCQPQCLPGYTANSPTLCLRGNLTETECEPNPCNVSEAPDHGGFGDCPSVLPSGDACQPSCAEGYTPDNVSSCWLGKLTAASCMPDLCNESIMLDSIPPNGLLGNCPAVLEHDTECQLECDPGYSASGRLECRFSSLSVVTCDPLPCNITVAPENGNLGDCPDMMESGESCQPICSDGYILSGNISCYLGNLSQEVCMPRPCPITHSDLPDFGGAGDCPAIISSGQSCLPSCNSGFTLSHPLSCWLGDLGISSELGVSNWGDKVSSMDLACHADHMPICIPSPCTVPLPEHGAHGGCPAVLPSGATCTVLCNEGYYGSGHFSCLLGNLTSRGLCVMIPTTTTMTSSSATTVAITTPAKSSAPVSRDFPMTTTVTKTRAGAGMSTTTSTVSIVTTSSMPITSTSSNNDSMPNTTNSSAIVASTSSITASTSSITTSTMTSTTTTASTSLATSSTTVVYIQLIPFSHVRYASGAKSTYGDHNVAKTMDGNCSTYYRSDPGQSSNQWVSYDFKEPQQVRGVQIYQMWNFQGPGVFTIAFSKDNFNWEEVPETFTVKQGVNPGDGTAPSACDDTKFENFTFSTVEAQYMRMNILSNRGTRAYLAVPEIRFLAPQATATVKTTIETTSKAWSSSTTTQTTVIITSEPWGAEGPSVDDTGDSTGDGSDSSSDKNNSNGSRADAAGCIPCPLLVPPVFLHEQHGLSQWNLALFWIGLATLIGTALLVLIAAFAWKKGKQKSKDEKSQDEPLKEVVWMSSADEVQMRLEAELSSERLKRQKLQRQLKAKEQFANDLDAELARINSLNEEMEGRMQMSLTDFQKVEVELASERTRIRELQTKQRTTEEEKAYVSNELSEERLLSRELQRRVLKLEEEHRELLAKITALKELKAAVKVGPRGPPSLETSGAAWDEPTSEASAPVSESDASMDKFNQLLVGVLLQALPGMQLLDPAGAEYFQGGDVGTVLAVRKVDAGPSSPRRQTSLAQSSQRLTSAASSAESQREPGLHVRWLRTGRTCDIAQTLWLWFRFIRTPDPQRGDFVQVLPGGDFEDSLGVSSCCSAGDVGHILSIDHSGEHGAKASVLWPRTAQTSTIPQGSWAWLHIVRATHRADTQSLSSAAVIAQELGISVLWMRTGEVVAEPKMGDILQAKGGASFTDEHGVLLYKDGDVGRVLDLCVVGTADLSATVLWIRSGRTSTLRRASWPSFTCLRLQEPKVGDLLQAPPGMASLDQDGKENYVPGDVGTVIRFFKAQATGEDCFGVLWARTGELSEYPTATTLARFYLIPLDSGTPVY